MYELGTRVRISSSWVDDDGSPTTPSAKTLVVTRPDGTSFQVDDGDIEVVEAGRLAAYVVMDQASRWWWRWHGSANIVGADQDSTWILRQRVPDAADV